MKSILERLSEFNDFCIHKRNEQGYFTIEAGGIRWYVDILTEEKLFDALVAAHANALRLEGKLKDEV